MFISVYYFSVMHSGSHVPTILKISEPSRSKNELYLGMVEEKGVDIVEHSFLLLPELCLK